MYENSTNNLGYEYYFWKKVRIRYELSGYARNVRIKHEYDVRTEYERVVNVKMI
jgi:hypothetical protein